MLKFAPLFAKTLLFSAIGIAASSLMTAQAADKAGKKPEVTLPDAGGEKVNIEQIKEKYWARGDESEMGVVQNRIYSKAEKIQFGLFSGITATDPFLSVRTLGLSGGFHFSEYLSLHAVLWRSFTTPSSALKTFQVVRGGETNYNAPRWYLGGEVVGSLIYGKLSFVGKKIIYYDMHVLFGSGMTKTDTGNYFTPSIGLGQQIYVGKRMSVKLDYRFMAYREGLPERVIPTKLGQIVGYRNNLSNSISLGLTYLLGADK